MLGFIFRLLFGSTKRQSAVRELHQDQWAERPPLWKVEAKPKTVEPAASPTIAAVVPNDPPLETTLTGKCYVVDGDTIRIGKVTLRLAGIDAPELDHPWGKKAKWELFQLCNGHTITAEIEPELSYDRLVATCYLPDGTDLGAEMVRRGMALDWTKFSGGKYAHLEPEGIRKKHWKAAARQRGHMSVFLK